MAGGRGAGGDGGGLIRADIRHVGESVGDGWVECDPAERIHNPDTWGESGTLVVRFALPVSTAELLQEALELLDEVGDAFRAGVEVPAGNRTWEALRIAIGKVATEMELAGLIEPDPLP